MVTMHRILNGHRHLTARSAVPDRDPVPPPDLPRYAPITDVLQPVRGYLCMAFGHHLDPQLASVGPDPTIVDGTKGISCQRATEALRMVAVLLRHRHKPLLAHQRFDNRAAAAAMPDGMDV